MRFFERRASLTLFLCIACSSEGLIVLVTRERCCGSCVTLANPEYALNSQFTLEQKALLDAVFDESGTVGAAMDAVGGPSPGALGVRMSR